MKKEHGFLLVIAGALCCAAVANYNGSMAITGSMSSATNVSSHYFGLADGMTNADGSPLLSVSQGTSSFDPTGAGNTAANNATNKLFLPSTNITTQIGTLAASSAQTNFTVNLLAGEHGNVQQVYLANTNCFITFTGTNITDASRCVLFRGWTNTINSVLKFNLPAYHTNAACSLVISNGQSAFFTFWNSDTSGSNVVVHDNGRDQ